MMLAGPAVAAWSPPELAGLVTDTRLAEVSGIAASQQTPGAFWAINDSDSAAELHLVSATGSRLASLPIEGVPNVDWEDLAAFTYQGRRYLLIADTGDNGGLRDTLSLIAIEEPREAVDGAQLLPAWTVRFRWPDGPRDCEAVVVDSVAGKILLISKKRVPAEMFQVSLRPERNTVQVARRIALLRGIAQPSSADLQRNQIYGRYRSQITSASLSPDGRTLAVLNYGAVYLYPRAEGERWSAALRNPSSLDFPWMPQAEAVTWAIDGGSLLIGGEQTPSPLIRYRLID